MPCGAVSENTSAYPGPNPGETENAHTEGTHGIHTRRKAAKILDERNITARRLALAIGKAPSNISHYLNGKTHTDLVNILEKTARELNVSVDYLLGLSDEETPAASEKREMTDFDKNFGHLTGDEDFLVIAGVYNVLPPKAKVFLVDFVRSYGIYQCVLDKDGKTVTPIDYNPKK